MQKNKTVMITGASRGIGRAAVSELARRGYNIVGIALNSSEKLEEAMNGARAFGVNALAVCGVDVGDYNSCKEKLYDYLRVQNISVDYIVNNAGISYVGLLQDMDISDWNRIVSTNLTSVFNTSKLFVPDMIRKECGKILNISSVWGNVGASCEVAYSATKGGINSFTKALAKELAPSGIQVNAVAFGAIDTEMNSFLSEEDKKMLTDEIPAGRMGNTEEAAKMIADILESPSYLNGQIITMDGAWI